MTHTSRANEDVSGGVADNESLEFLGDAVLGFVDRRPAVPRVPGVRRRAEVEDQGGAGLDDDAGAAGRAADARRSPAARPRRGEDRRPPQAGAARRRLRGADRGDLSRRRHRAGARVHRARVRAAARRGAPSTASAAQDYKSALQEQLQSRERAAARVPAGRHARARSPQAVSGGGRRERRGAGRGDRAEQEGSGAGGGPRHPRQIESLGFEPRARARRPCANAHLPRVRLGQSPRGTRELDVPVARRGDAELIERD